MTNLKNHDEYTLTTPSTSALLATGFGRRLV